MLAASQHASLGSVLSVEFPVSSPSCSNGGFCSKGMQLIPNEPFPFQYQQCSKGAKSLPSAQGFPSDVLEQDWQSTACAWALALPASTPEAAAAKSWDPSACPKAFTLWLTAVRALPTSGKDSQAEDRIFYGREK